MRIAWSIAALIAPLLLAAPPVAARQLEGPPAPPPDSAPAPEPPAPPLDRGDQLAPPPLTRAEIAKIDAEVRAAELHRNRIKAVLLSEPPYLLTFFMGSFLMSIDADQCLGNKDEEECDEPLDWREGAEGTLPLVISVLGTMSALSGSIITTAIHNRAVSYRTRFSATMLGSILGLGLDAGLMAILFFKTESAAALIWPTAAGFLLLPPLGGAIGNALSRRDVEWIQPGTAAEPMARVELSPPLPVPIAAADGRAAPGVALGGSF